MTMRFQQAQLEFTGLIRRGQSRNNLDLPEERLQIYIDLVFNNVEQFLSKTFPVLRSLTTYDDWYSLVREFLEYHKAQSPYFLKISEEFLSYIQSNSARALSLFPFFMELAHYEWLELVVDVADYEFLSEHSSLSLRDDSVLKISPLAILATYQFPVHKICRSFIPREPSTLPVNLLVYRNRNDQVNFMELNHWSALLLHCLQGDDSMRVEQLIGKIYACANQMGITQQLFPSELQIKEEIERLLRSDVIIF